MAGSPGHDAAQLQQQLQQHMLTAAAAAAAGDLHHHQYAPHPPPPSTSSSSPWQALNELTELPPDDMDDGSLPPPPPLPPHPAGVTPFQQLVGSFGPADSFGPGGGSVSAGTETDDDTVVSLDEPLHHHAVVSAGRADTVDAHKHQTRSAGHVLFAPQQRLNAPA